MEMAPTMNTNGSSSSFVWDVQKATQSANGEQDISHARGRSDSNNRFWMILARRSLHFTSFHFPHLPIWIIWVLLKVFWPCLTPCLTHLFWTSHYILDSGDMPSMFSSYFVVNAQPKRGPKRISFSASKRDPMIQTWPKTKAQQHGSALRFLTK